MLFAVAALAMLAAVRQQNRTYALMLSVAAGAALLLYALPQLAAVIKQASALAAAAGRDTGARLGVLLKAAAAALLGEWGVNICRDAGENALGFKLETAVRILLIASAMPIYAELLSLALEVLRDAGGGLSG
ncbi:MAG: stage III sporulation AC/AD family protein [Oscillospiraceae bacterium]|nr:MAG: stage III sporulation AC/AD family protein [Oscillospiraceae bacterium]